MTQTRRASFLQETLACASRAAKWCGARHIQFFALAVVAVVSTACARNEPPEPPPQLAIADDRAAMAFMGHFFNAYVNIDVEVLVKMLCEDDRVLHDKVRAFVHAAQAPGSPLRINEFTVRSVELMWIEQTPHHRVEVSFPRRRGNGQILQVFSVRAREGCLEGFVEPPGADELMPRSSPEAEHGPLAPPLVPPHVTDEFFKESFEDRAPDADDPLTNEDRVPAVVDDKEGSVVPHVTAPPLEDIIEL